MKVLRNIVGIVFIACLVLFGYTVFKGAAETDSTYPEIHFEENVIRLETGDSEERLLEGVTAYDGKDGDLTSKVFVESISNFVEPGVSNVTYVVYDADRHAAKASRKVVYLDYTPPRFVLHHSPVYHVGDKISLTDFIGAEDVIDGDISANVRFSTSTVPSNTEGIHQLTVTVSNSKGDTSELSLKVKVEGDSNVAPKIELKQYILYLHKGDSFSARDSIVSASKADGTRISVSQVEIESNVQTEEEGVYSAVYTVRDENGNKGTTEMIVVVEGEEEQ